MTKKTDTLIKKYKYRRALQAQRAKIKLMEDSIPVVDMVRSELTVYNEIVAEYILGRLSAGESLKKICKTPGYPTSHTVMQWVNYPNEIQRPGFQDRYLQAREVGYHLMADELVDIADDSSKDIKKKWVGGKEIEVIDQENIARDRLRVDTRKFILSKVLPKIYGDSIKIEHSGSVDLIARLDAARLRLIKEDERESQKVIEGTAEEIQGG
jgi:hypothetical protein